MTDERKNPIPPTQIQGQPPVESKVESKLDPLLQKSAQQIIDFILNPPNELKDREVVQLAIETIIQFMPEVREESATPKWSKEQKQLPLPPNQRQFIDYIEKQLEAHVYESGVKQRISDFLFLLTSKWPHAKGSEFIGDDNLNAGIPHCCITQQAILDENRRLVLDNGTYDVIDFLKWFYKSPKNPLTSAEIKNGSEDYRRIYEANERVWKPNSNLRGELKSALVELKLPEEKFFMPAPVAPNPAQQGQNAAPAQQQPRQPRSALDNIGFNVFLGGVLCGILPMLALLFFLISYASLGTDGIVGILVGVPAFGVLVGLGASYRQGHFGQLREEWNSRALERALPENVDEAKLELKSESSLQYQRELFKSMMQAYGNVSEVRVDIPRNAPSGGTSQVLTGIRLGTNAAQVQPSPPSDTQLFTPSDSKHSVGESPISSTGEEQSREVKSPVPSDSSQQRADHQAAIPGEAQQQRAAQQAEKSPSESQSPQKSSRKQ